MLLNSNFNSFMQALHQSRKNTRIFACDLETSGLNDSRNIDGMKEGESGAGYYPILQIAVIIYNGHFEQLGEPIDIVIYQDEDILEERTNEWSKEQFENTLMIQCPKSEVTLEEAEQLVIGHIEQFGIERDGIEKGTAALMLGNSIRLDMEFISAQMPTLKEYLHYRLLDVSVLKEFFTIIFGKEYARVPKQCSHDALSDIRESVMELEYFLDNFIVSPDEYFRNKIMKNVFHIHATGDSHKYLTADPLIQEDKSSGTMLPPLKSK